VYVLGAVVVVALWFLLREGGTQQKINFGHECIDHLDMGDCVVISEQQQQYRHTLRKALLQVHDCVADLFRLDLELSRNEFEVLYCLDQEVVQSLLAFRADHSSFSAQRSYFLR